MDTPNPCDTCIYLRKGFFVANSIKPECDLKIQLGEMNCPKYHKERRNDTYKRRSKDSNPQHLG